MAVNLPIHLFLMSETTTALKKARALDLLQIAIIVFLAAVPLFLSFPYRVNIFLSWEGAYRLSEGQVPYKDFGMPLGFMYWVIPSVFFKLFGAQLITLVKAQVFINLLSGFAFMSILRSLTVPAGIRFLAVLLYCISYSFFNFWPWYNHTVIVYELIGIAFLLKYMFMAAAPYRWLLLSVSALFIFFSFFTKQDGGALGFILASVLLLYHCLHHKRWLPFVLFTGSFLVISFCVIAPFTAFNFGYWFNYGQAPHTARFSVAEIITDFFAGSAWIKFYLFVIALLVIAYYKSWRQFVQEEKQGVFLLLTLGVLAEAAILQVTSYTPPDNNIFFHSFAVAFILTSLSNFLKLDFLKAKPLFTTAFFLLLWWSSSFWKYIQRVTDRFMPTADAPIATSENMVNRSTYMLSREQPEIPMSEWVFSGLKSFEKIYMPKPTAEGLQRLLRSPLIKNGPSLQVLNMTELTPLIIEMNYASERGPSVPLWHHLGVAMFNKEAAVYEEAISREKYDLVLFEYIPALNNFYPFRVRDSLLVHYQKTDSFPAPRRGDTRGMIEIYQKKIN
ncbi:MAG: hypothetical protein WKF70_10905 [Chitinophagaceae bacterium]